MKNWNLVKAFVHVANTGSLTAAAEELGTAPSSVGRMIQCIEEEFGLILFKRSPKGYVLTDSGQHLLNHGVHALEAVNAFSKQGLQEQEHGVSGRLCIALPELIASVLVIPALKSFIEQYPNLELEFLVGNDVERLSEREVDIAVRLVKPSEQTTVFFKAGTIQWGLYAAKTYYEQKILHRSESVINIICWDSRHLHLSKLQSKEYFPSFAFREISASSMVSQVAAVTSGLGVGCIPDFASSGLKKIASEQIEQPIYVAYHEDFRKSEKIRIMANKLKEIFQAH